MTGRPMRLTVSGLLAGVALAAVLLAAHRAGGPAGLGAAIVLACVVLLAGLFGREAASRGRSGGGETGLFRTAGIVLGSLAAAAALVGASDLGFVAAYFGYLKIAESIWLQSHDSPYQDPFQMGVGTSLGLALALASARAIVRTFGLRGEREAGPARPWPGLWPILATALIGLGLASEAMWERWRHGAVMAEYHAERERESHDPSLAARHRLLKEGDAAALWRPWRPLDPP